MVAAEPRQPLMPLEPSRELAAAWDEDREDTPLRPGAAAQAGHAREARVPAPGLGATARALVLAAALLAAMALCARLAERAGRPLAGRLAVGTGFFEEAAAGQQRAGAGPAACGEPGKRRSEPGGVDDPCVPPTMSLQEEVPDHKGCALAWEKCGDSRWRHKRCCVEGTACVEDRWQPWQDKGVAQCQPTGPKEAGPPGAHGPPGPEQGHGRWHGAGRAVSDGLFVSDAGGKAPKEAAEGSATALALARKKALAEAVASALRSAVGGGQGHERPGAAGEDTGEAGKGHEAGRPGGAEHAEESGGEGHGREQAGHGEGRKEEADAGKRPEGAKAQHHAKGAQEGEEHRDSDERKPRGEEPQRKEEGRGHGEDEEEKGRGRAEPASGRGHRSHEGEEKSGGQQSKALTWRARDALPREAGESMHVPLAGMNSLDDMKQWCELQPECGGFAYMNSAKEPYFKQRDTGFDPRTADWDKTDRWQYLWIEEREPGAEGRTKASARPEESGHEEELREQRGRGAGGQLEGAAEAVSRSAEEHKEPAHREKHEERHEGSEAEPAPEQPCNFPRPPAGFEGYTNFYNGENPLGIAVNKEARSKNYFLIIGDWGKFGGPGPCQLAVADLMKAYIEKQRRQGKRLLFIASVGDNFYWNGVTRHTWDVQWAEPYGANDPSSPLHKVPWLAVMGNHDFGNADPFAFCPEAKPLHKIWGQAYASLQLNRDRNPSRPRGTELFWMPDFNYHYAIPEADLEVIAVDTNAFEIDQLGGDASGHAVAFELCGGRAAIEKYLMRVNEAGRELLRERARKTTASTVVILQHYPGRCQNDIFNLALPLERRDKVKVLCAYGHVHNQTCNGRDATGNCNLVLSGGGGGCCAPEINLAGFTAVDLTDDGGFKTDLESPDVRLPFGHCPWRRLKRLQVAP